MISTGTRLGRYEIRSQLGAGGMGEVYRSHDEKLNRDVAIKVLPAALSQDTDRLRRFEQEAQAAGALNHPKILDFGLAKLIEPVGIGQILTDLPTRKLNTTPGTVMGTLGYMSPEQVDGKSVDYRSDIFSFGVVLYEMLAGRRAFAQRETLRETLHAIATEDPPALSELNPHVSPSLEKVVERCLEEEARRSFSINTRSGVRARGIIRSEYYIAPGTEHHAESRLKDFTSSRRSVESTSLENSSSSRNARGGCAQYWRIHHGKESGHDTATFISTPHL